MIDFLLPLILLLLVVIFFHELGHYAVAKWLGVRVERFSLGFGPALLSRTVGETEYRVSALPLGGYVKMTGEMPGEELPEPERARAFNCRPPWQRIAISVAGPAMNVVLPVLLIAGMLMVGVPVATSRIGGVLADTPAERAGLLAGDRVVQIDGREIGEWSELTAALNRSDAPRVALVVERDGGRHSIDVVRERDANGFLGRLGIRQATPAAMVAVPDPDSPAARAGLETGDLVLSVGGDPVNDLEALRNALTQAPAGAELEVERRIEGDLQTLRTSLRDAGGDRSLEALGLHPLDFQIRDVNPTTPARRAGLREGDIFLSVDGEALSGKQELVAAVRGSEGRPLAFEILRDGNRLTLEVAPVLTPVLDGEDLETPYALGISLGPQIVGGEMRRRHERNPLKALWAGATQTVMTARMIFRGIGEMVSGSVGMEQIAGPIGIGEIAADTFKSSWLQFLSFMGVISVNLAIVNLLPVPVLDGGAIMLAGLEWIRGGPLPDRLRDFAQTVGLSFILLLMGFAFWNDIARNWEGIVGFFLSLV
ncbi:MAG: RIP metalloprotease RseP [Proteobacteria bacterium]|nr:RIP metalloprotease RseP [Pseudomonadota bacterium]